MNLQLLANLEEVRKQIANLQGANALTQNIAQGANDEIKKLKLELLEHKQLLREVKAGNPYHDKLGQFTNETNASTTSENGGGSSSSLSSSRGSSTSSSSSTGSGAGSSNSTNVSTYNSKRAIDIARNNIVDPKEHQSGNKQCAKKVREALEATTGKTMIRPESTYAKDYGEGMASIDFEPVKEVSQGVGYPPNDGFELEEGDVAVIQTTSKSKYGHMAIYAGKDKNGNEEWISDFVQKRGAYPGPSYREEKPSYVIYRHKNKTKD